MNYSFLPFNIVHFDKIPENITEEFLDSTTKGYYEIYPLFENQLPILIRWTFRIKKINQDIFSCVGEGRYLLNFMIGTDHDSDLDSLIRSSIINLQIEWEEKVRGTYFEGNTIPSPSSTEIKIIKDDILKEAKNQNLLT